MNRVLLIFLTIVLTISLAACGEPQGDGDRDPTPNVFETTADGTDVFDGNVSTIDMSNKQKGYVMVKYGGDKSKIKLQVNKDGGAVYTYDLDANGRYEAFPLSLGSGNYTFVINENISGNSYAVVDSTTFEVTLETEFSPFLHPSQYVSFLPESAIVPLSQELATGASTDLDVVTSVYEYVVENIEYDYEKADAVDTFYIPSIDETLTTKKGLCFDYAAVMTSMLRVQGIPTQLVIGYAGETYHAWLSVYTEETGWINDMIEFDGEEWVRLDPTFASTNEQNPDIYQYIGDGTNYNAMYFY